MFDATIRFSFSSSDATAFERFRYVTSAGRVPAAVVADVVGRDLCERDVADSEVERSFGCVELLELRGVDSCRCSVEVLGDAGGGAVGFDADEFGAGGSESDEVPRTTAGLEHPAAGEAEPLDRAPHGLNDVGGGVVGVEDGAAGFGPRGVVGEEAAGAVAVLGVGGVVLVEQLREAAPPGPAGEDRLVLRRCGRAAAEPVEDFERLEVGGELGGGPGRGEVGLASGPERYGWTGASSVQSAAIRLVALETRASRAR